MRVVVVGAGPSGMMASITSAKEGNEVILIDKNEKLGKKLFITGKGRCNITNNCDNKTFLDNVVSNPKFLMSAINSFNTNDAMAFFENSGLKLKVERGNRVFPMSDKSSDVIKAFEKELIKNNVDIRLNTKAIEIIAQNNKVEGIKTDKGILLCDKLIIATGGVSYPITGSTGDGYELAKKLNHTITPLLPALVGINLKEEWISNLAGLSLKNVALRVMRDGEVLASDFGEMLFTHNGISGPIVLSLSSKINKQKGNLKIMLDLKPSLSIEQLDNRILRDFEENKNKEFKNVIDSITVKALVPHIIQKSNINPTKKVNSITKVEREKLVYTIKNFEFSVDSLCGIASGIVTSGGISTKEINPKNMASKLIQGLYFCGEVIDVDALTGGYNIQIAMSTGYLAGLN